MKAYILKKVRAWGILCPLLFTLFFCFFSLSVKANNIRSEGVVKITAGASGSGVATLSFDLSWDNSWRDGYNWDAAWIFLKYSTGGEWKHVMLKATGHTLSNSYAYTAGKSGGSTTGLFICRQDEGAGASAVTCQLQWELPTELMGYTQKQLDEKGVYVRAQGVEMVYIPYGAYSLGDGSSDLRLGDAAGEPLFVAGEDLASVNISGGSAVALSANYPRGYQGFYAMKYEVSQEQYVAFLNTLTFVQQKQLLPGVESLSKGQFIFGSPTEPTNRNGIVVSNVSDGTSAITFDNNLNNNDTYGEDGDGKCVACNYMSVQDMLSYCSWSGLRPMSEMEYEKACRHPYPDKPVAGEYAWNDASAPKGVTSLTGIGTRTERPGDGGTVNANFGNLLSGADAGPVRCGSFAAKQPGQVTSGATYWGVMEMSGNLKELCCNVTHPALDRALHGDGAYSLSKWTTDAGKFGYRGGDFTSGDFLLRISDRSQAAAVTDLAARDKSAGFRGVFQLDGNAVQVDPKTISAGGDTAVCSGGSFTVSGDEASVVDGSSLSFTYGWFVKKPGSSDFEAIPDEVGATLTFTDGYVNTDTTQAKYVFKRKAVCALGEATTPEFTLAIINPEISLSATTSIIDACDNGTSITAKSTMTDVVPKYQWTYMGTVLDTTATYRPIRADFTDLNIENKTVVCRADIRGCIQTAILVVSVPEFVQVNSEDVTMENCGKVVVYDTRSTPQTYCTVLIPGGEREGEILPDQCWFGKNLNIGDRVPGTDYSTHTTAGIQKICYGDNEKNCDRYGGLYSWEETVNGEQAGAVKYVFGVSGAIQGICPDGWHVPGDAEWQILERNLGMTKAEAGKTNTWCGTDQGTQMKMPGTFEGTVWCTGGDCNKSGFNGLPGGIRHNTGGTYRELGLDGLWWSSTVYDATFAWDRGLHYDQSGVGSYYTFRTYGFSVRCIKNLDVVAPTAVTMENCGKVIVKDERESVPQHYGTVKIPGGVREGETLPDQCWFSQNMNTGTVVPGTDYNTHTTAGIQKLCYNNDEKICDKYGGLYSWEETVYGEQTSGLKYVPGSFSDVQGICPDGWHVPSDAEFQVLERNLGMTKAEAGKAKAWRGTDQGTQLKMPGTFEGTNWCTGADCNKSGFNGLPSGIRNYTGGSWHNLGMGTYWWSSTLQAGGAWRYWLQHNYSAINRHSETGLAYGFSVRCIKNIETVPSTAVTMENCGKVIVKDDRESVPQHYGTVKIPGGMREGETLPDQCWFSQNMNIGTVVTGATFNTHTMAGIQRICYNNDTKNCDQYGGLYNWEETVYGEQTSGIKYVSGTSGDIQGICPNGWHVPSDAEWQILERNLGMTKAQVGTEGYRGTNQGAQLKMPGTFEGTVWCTGADCNKSGFNGLPDGYRHSTDESWFYLGSRAYWWSSTVNDATTAWYRRLDKGNTTVDRGLPLKSNGISVRCVINIESVPSTAVTMENCGKVTVKDDRESVPQHYGTVKIPGGVREGETLPDQCWFSQNMNIGTVVPGATLNTHTMAGIQRICYNNDTKNCDQYGGLYNWEETVYGENTGAIKYVSGTSGAVQGICPNGWHVPSDAEWQMLERNLGMTRAAAGAIDWRGTDQGTQMKMPGTFEGTNWCTGADCNKSGFSALPGGYRYFSNETWYLLGSVAHWWLSNDAMGVWYRHLDAGFAMAFRKNNNPTSFAFSVRCIMN